MKPQRIRRGSVTVKLYCVPHAGKNHWEVRWHYDGQIHRAKRTSKKAALLLAEDRATAIANGSTARDKFTCADAIELEQSREAIRPTGKTILQISLEEKSRWEEKQKLTGPEGAGVAALIEKFLAAKKSEGIGDYYQRDLDARLMRFAADFKVPLVHVRSEELTLWLDALKVGPRTWNNYLSAIKSLTTWCRKRRLIDADWRGDEIDPRKLAWKRPQIYTPEEIRTMLLQAGPNLARCIALSAFAGLRTEEVAGIEWKDFRWEQNFIHVDETVAKTRQHAPPILDALRPWIGTIEQAGKFSPYKDAKSLSGMKVALAKRLGIPARRNGLRKSWISYRLALIQNEAQVADEAGTSLADIRKHYLSRPPLAEAQKWFGIRPNFVPQNITQLAFHAIC